MVLLILCFILFVAGLTVLCSVDSEYEMLIHDINEVSEKLKEQQRREMKACEQLFYHQLCAYVPKYEDTISWMKFLLEAPFVGGEKEEFRAIKKCLRYVFRQGILHNAIALEAPKGVLFPQDSPLLQEKMEILRKLRNTALDLIQTLKSRKAVILKRLQDEKNWVFRKQSCTYTYEGLPPPIRKGTVTYEETKEEKVEKEQERVRKKNIRRATRNKSF